jgi:PEP-CTERM motif
MYKIVEGFIMMVYRKQTESSAKWLVAFLLFAAVMTFTVDEAFGMPAPGPRSWNNSTNYSGSSNDGPSSYGSYTHSNYRDCGGESEPSPNAVPEPTTLILFGLGLVAAGAAKRRAKL